MRIAYFSPLNPIQSGISDYSEELLPYLARHADVDLFVDGYRPANAAITRQFRVVDGRKPGAVERAGGYDAVIYHMGNSPAHAYMWRAMKQTPGIVVMHDYVLHHLMVWMALNRREAKWYLSAMEKEYGEQGAALGQRVLKGQLPETMFDYPMSEEVVRRSQGMIVHSEHVKGLVRRVRPNLFVQQVNMGVPLASRRDPVEARARLGLSPGTFVVASFGHLNPYKRLDSALRAFAAFSAEVPDSLYLLVGSPSPNYNVDRVIDLFNLRDRVRLVGYTPGDVFADYVAASDVCVNLRYPTAGETSASLLRIMGAGKPVFVSATGWFNELPDDCCIKIDVDDCEEELIHDYLRALWSSPALRHGLGANALEHVAREHTMEGAAQGYVELLERLASPSGIRTPVPALPASGRVSNAPHEHAGGPSMPRASESPALPASTVNPIGSSGSAPQSLAPEPESSGAEDHSIEPWDADPLVSEVAAVLTELGFDPGDDILREVAVSIDGAGLAPQRNERSPK